VTDTKGTPLVPTDAWRSAFRGAVVGALVMHDVRNPEQNSALEAEKRRLEERLRGAETPSVDRVAQAYADYYRVRDKTYPVKAQRDSVAVKGKPIPSQAALARGDMMMADGAGIISSVHRGPDLRTRIAPPTRNVLFAAYAPAGVGEDAVRAHLERLHANVELVAPEARTEELTTESAL
jgi:DNA/RNA-binding domain of Phe-tRNA-synthetase-like protein